MLELSLKGLKTADKTKIKDWFGEWVFSPTENKLESNP